MHPYLDAPLPLAFAHRGGAAAGDENTMAAFARAVELGYRYLETDVHATVDGVPVVFHDARLERLTGRRGRIGGWRWADLATLRVGGAAVIPRLADVLDAWPRVRFNIDVKADAGVAPTVAVLRRAGAFDRVLLASFSDVRLARLRRAADAACRNRPQSALSGGPGAAYSLGVRGVARLRLTALTGRRLVLPPGVVAAQVPVRYGRLRVLDRRFLRHAHRLGLQVHAWTIDDPVEMADLLDLGVDGIMTDRLNVLRDVYARRGLWQ